MGKLKAPPLALLSAFIACIFAAVYRETLPHMLISSATITKAQLSHLLRIPTSNAPHIFATSQSAPPAAAHGDHNQRPMRQSQQNSSPSRQQVENVILILRRAGVYGAIAGAIDDMDLDQLPQDVTLFVPTDSALGSAGSTSLPSIVPNAMEYHIATQLLSFTDLLQLPTGSRLPTLLPGKSILVTRSDPVLYTIDGVGIVSPDLYMDQTIAIHGINGVFNYTVFGEESTASVETPPTAALPFLNDSTVLGEPNLDGFEPSESSAAALLASFSADASFLIPLLSACFILYITLAAPVQLLQLIINV